MACPCVTLAQEAQAILDKYQSVAGGAMGRAQRAFYGPSDFFVSQ